MEETLTRQTIFSDIFRYGLWGKGENVSGTIVEKTHKIRDEIQSLLLKLEIKSIIDCGCNNLNWMRLMFSFFEENKIKYTGIDIVNELIETNKLKFQDYEFYQCDTVEGFPYKADLIFCRDILVHLCFNDIKNILRNWKTSESSFILMTSFPEHDNGDCKIGQWRPLNFQKEPFNLPKPRYIINEDCMTEAGKFKDKSLCLWRLEDI